MESTTARQLTTPVCCLDATTGCPASCKVMSAKRTIALIILVALAGTLLAYAIYTAFRIHSVGTIKTVGLSCSTTTIDWGLIAPGESKIATVSITNNGTVPVTTHMITENWNPSVALAYITCTWDAEGVILQPSESRNVTFTLTVASNCTGFTSFTFDIVLTGVEE